MSDEERAEEYATEQMKSYLTLDDYSYGVLKLKITEAYLDGLAEGKPKWHDLKKNPDDLPKDKGGYWTKYNGLNEERGGYYDVHYFDPNNPFYKQKWYKLDVIAWCELPKFEEDNRGK